MSLLFVSSTTTATPFIRGTHPSVHRTSLSPRTASHRRVARTCDVLAPRRRRGVVMMAESSESAADAGASSSPEQGEDVVFDDEVREPYPGYFGDMKRMGMSDEEARAQAIKAMRQSQPVVSDKVGGAKNLYRDDGTPYAPWMAGFPTEYNNAVVKKRTDATGRLAADPQRGELSGVGLTWRIVGDNDALELAWATGAEENNRGFVVYRRQGKSDRWDKLADYKSNSDLLSKGSNGGKYTFSVPEPQPGTWVYRVSDCDESDNVADLAQVLVDVESPEDSKLQKVALVALVILLLAAAAAGIFLDPQNSYS